MEITYASHLVFILSLSLFYTSRIPIYLGALDPFKIQALQEAVWVTTFYEFYQDGYINNFQAKIFAVSIAIWLMAWFIVCKCYGTHYKNTMKLTWLKLSSLKRNKSNLIFLIFYISLFFYCIYVFNTSGGGDNRLETNKALRLIEPPVYLLSAYVIFKLLISQYKSAKILLIITLLALVYIGGKIAGFVILLPLTAAIYIGKIKLRLTSYILIVAFIFIMLIVSMFLNYQSNDIPTALASIIHRFLMEGDIYFYSFVQNGINYAEVESLIAYIFSPLLKALFIPLNYDLNVGAQISSGLAGINLYTGPNAHWPIILISSGITSTIDMIFITMLFFLLIIFIKFNILKYYFKKINPICLAPCVSYIAQYPQTGFADPNISIIFIVHLLYLSVILLFLNAFVKR